MAEGERTIITEIIDQLKMGTKLYIMFASWLVTALNIQFMPLSWQISELSFYAVTMGACSGYNLWLLWNDQEEIIIGIITLYEFKK